MNSVGYLFQMSHWQTGLVFSLMIIGMILVYITWKKTSRKHAFLAATILGLTLGGIIGLLDSFYPVSQIEQHMIGQFNESVFPTDSWQSEALVWLEVVPGIFISAFFFLIPILIFSQSVTTISRFYNRYNTKHYLASIIFSMLLAVFSMIVAYALIPVWSRINIDYFTHVFETEPVDPTIPGIIGTWVPNSVSIFTSIIFVVSLAFLGIFIGFIILYLLRTKNKSGTVLNNFFRNTNSLLKVSIEWIGRLLPFVVFCTIPQLFFNHFSLNLTEILILGAFITLGLVFIYFCQIALGSLITSRSKYKPIQFAKHNWNIATVGFKFEAAEEITHELTEFVEHETDEYQTNELVKLNTDKMARMGTSTFYTLALAITTAFSYVGTTSHNGTLFEMKASFWIVLTVTVLIIAFATAGTPEGSAVSSTTSLSAMTLPVDLYLIMHCVEPLIGTVRNGIDANGIILTSLFVKWLDKRKPFSKKEKKVEEVIDNV